MASARAKTSRPHPCADDIGVRNRPSAERGPKPNVLIRQPHTRITAGVRQPIELDVCGLYSIYSIARSRGSRDRPLHRLLYDRQIDQRRSHAEEHRQPPHDVVGSGALEQEPAEPHAEEAADLVTEEGKAEQ